MSEHLTRKQCTNQSLNIKHILDEHLLVFGRLVRTVSLLSQKNNKQLIFLSIFFSMRRGFIVNVLNIHGLNRVNKQHGEPADQDFFLQ